MIELTWTITKKRIIGYSVAFILLLVVVPSSLYVWQYEYYHYPPLDFKYRPQVSSPLIRNIPSYQSTAEFENYLNNEGLKWEVFEDEEHTKSVKEGNIPEAHLKSYKVFDFEDKGYKGLLMSKFFNDRLMFTWFAIEKSAEYMEKNYPLYNYVSAEPKIIKGTNTVIGRGGKNGAMLSWTDKRLNHEWLLWIKRYWVYKFQEI